MACTCAILSTQHTSSLFTAAQEKEGGPGKARNTYACYARFSLFSHLVACLSYWQWTVVSSISIELYGVETSIRRASPLVFRCDLGWIRRTNVSPPCERRSGPGCSDEVATRRQRTRWLPRIKDPILHHCRSLKAVPVTQLAFLGVASLLYSGLPSLPRSVRPIARFFHLNHGGRGTARTSFRQCTRS
jgi:hypothetical protein